MADHDQKATVAEALDALRKTFERFDERLSAVEAALEVLELGGEGSDGAGS
jgi:hypothetical protein